MVRDRPGPVKSVSTTFRVVEALDELGTARVTELATHLGMTKSTVYKHLDTLRTLGYVRKSDGLYSLSLRVFSLGTTVRDGLKLFETARPHVDALARTTGESVSLIVEEQGDTVCLYQKHGGRHTKNVHDEGARHPVVETVSGRAILSFRPESEIKALLSAAGEPAKRYQDLLPKLRSIRDRQLAIDRTADRRQIAIAIRDMDDYAIGALSVSGPASSLSGKRLEEDVAGLVVSKANDIEVEFGL